MMATRRSMLAIGARVGPYRIVGELGGGGMGMVYRAVHVLLDRPAAIKVMRPEAANYPVAIDRFLTEARATTAIRHPGIVEIYDYGHTDSGHAFIAMELLEGRTLGMHLAERGRLEVFEAATIARRIAAPLIAAHERGVIHRDLKPDNVFLIRDHDGGVVDQVKILDFGIAKLENTATSNRTTVGLVLGTPTYMSPEQCRGAACDHRTDLYALGCIMYEMLTGDPPYSDILISAELMAAHLHAPIPDLQRFTYIPPQLAQLVRRLLAKRLEERPGNALEVIRELDRWLNARGLSPPARRRPPRRAIVSACVLACGFAGLGAIYRAWRTPSNETPPNEIVEHRASHPATSALTGATEPRVSPASDLPGAATLPLIVGGPGPALQSPAQSPSPARPAQGSSPARALASSPAQPARASVPAPASPPAPVHASSTVPDAPSLKSTSPPPSLGSSNPAAPSASSTITRRPSPTLGEVTTDLGKASVGDVNTIVNDVGHN